METPRTQYARSGELNIAYQVLGDGPIDLVRVPGFVSHLEVQWEFPPMDRMLRRLASFSRLIMLDKRGTGMSDRTSDSSPPTLEDRMDDVRAVMDAVGSEQAVLYGVSEGGPMSVLFAATYPERTRALILYGTYARFTRADDYPWAMTREQVERVSDGFRDGWGEPGLGAAFAPSMQGDAAMGEAWARMSRLSASPGAVASLMRANAEMDVRDVLPSITVPTLVVHRTGDRVARVGNARYLASHIPGATLVELPGDDHVEFAGDPERFLEVIQEFITGAPAPVESERVLATVLFTDLVDSTRREAEAGDRRWAELLDSHDALVRRQLERFQGRLVKSTGDGILATFDGPARAVRCAWAIREGLAALGLEVRAGLHIGEIEVRGDDVSGLAVNIASRIESLAGPSEILVSGTITDLVVGSGITFSDRGAVSLKGVPGEWRTAVVTSI